MCRSKLGTSSRIMPSLHNSRTDGYSNIPRAMVEVKSNTTVKNTVQETRTMFLLISSPGLLNLTPYVVIASKTDMWSAVSRWGSLLIVDPS